MKLVEQANCVADKGNTHNQAVGAFAADSAILAQQTMID
jgi:hypothetical protein